jgi:hypothetical protein
MILLVLAGLMLQPPIQSRPAQNDPVAALRGTINRILAEKRFDKSSLPTSVFDPEKLDPLLVQAQWETVRPQLEKACARYVQPGQSLKLCLHFQSPPSVANRLQVAFHEPDNPVIRSALVSTFGIKNEQFRRFAPSNQANAVVLGELAPEFMKTNKQPDLIKVHRVLGSVFQKDENDFRKFKLSVLDLPNNPTAKKLVILTSWVFYGESKAPKEVRYYWRIHLELENFKDDAWGLKLVLDLGNRYAADAGISKIGDSDSLASSDMPTASLNSGTFLDTRENPIYKVDPLDNGTEEISDPRKTSRLLRHADTAFSLCVEKVMKKESPRKL